MKAKLLSPKECPCGCNAPVTSTPAPVPGKGGNKYVPYEDRTGNESIVYFTRKLWLTCKLPWGGYPKSLHSLNMKNGRSDTPLS